MAQQRRHFLRGRWLDPADPADEEMLRPILAKMPPHQAKATIDLLTEFSRWKPGPAGRGGERTCRKRSLSPSGSLDEESDAETSTGHSTPRARFSSKRRAVVLADTQTHTHKRVSAVTVPSKACEGEGERSLLELLCMVATRVEAASPLRSSSSSASISSKDDSSSPSEAGIDTPVADKSDSNKHHVTSKREVAELEVETPRTPSPVQSCMQVEIKVEQPGNPKNMGLSELGGSPAKQHGHHASICEESSFKIKECKSKADRSEGGHTAAACMAAESAEPANKNSDNISGEQDNDNQDNSSEIINKDSLKEQTGNDSVANATNNNIKDENTEAHTTNTNSQAGGASSTCAAARSCSNRPEVPAPFASLFKPSVVDEGMSRYPLQSYLGPSTGEQNPAE